MGNLRYGLLINEQIRIKCHEIVEALCNYYMNYCCARTVYEANVHPSNNNQSFLRDNQQTQLQIQRELNNLIGTLGVV